MADEIEGHAEILEKERIEMEYAAQRSSTPSLGLGSLRTPKVRSVVMVQIEELKKQLAEREQLLKDLDALPQVEQLLDRMRRLGV